MPPLFSSQPCEAFFRQIRSMSTTYSTIVNCSLLDVSLIIHRIKKIQLQSDILASKLNRNISFSRIEHKVKTIQIQSNLPTNDDIYEVIEEARKKAITDAHKFDLEPGELNCNLPLVVDARADDFKADFDNKNQNENDILYDYVDDTKENSTIISASTSRSMEQEDDEFPSEDILEDMSILSCVSDGYLNMKNYGETTLVLNETSPFTIVADAHGKEIVLENRLSVGFLIKIVVASVVIVYSV